MNYSDELDKFKAEIEKVRLKILEEYSGKWVMTTPKKKSFKYARVEKPVPFKVAGADFKSTKTSERIAYKVIIFWGYADPDNNKTLRRGTYLIERLPDPFETRDSALLYREVCSDSSD